MSIMSFKGLTGRDVSGEDLDPSKFLISLYTDWKFVVLKVETCGKCCFIFKILGIDGPAQRFWLNLKPDTWEEIVPYRTLCRFVKTLAVVNDESERGVRVAEDYTKRVKNETMRQDLFQCIQRRREILKLYGTRNKKDLQQSFSALSKKNA